MTKHDKQQCITGIFGRGNATIDTPAPAQLGPELTGTYTIDPAHSTIGFVARHAMVINVTGGFKEFEGTPAPGRREPLGLHRVPGHRDGRHRHRLRGPRRPPAQRGLLRHREAPPDDLPLDVRRALGGDSYRITGDLSILGTTRQVAIDLEFNGLAKDPFGNERVGFEGTSSLLGSEYGLTWNAALETGGVLVSDKIRLTFDISAIKQG